MLHQHEQLPDLAEMDEVFDLTGNRISLFFSGAVLCITL